MAQTSAPFVYQGRLTEAGNPSTGTYEMEFKLFDTPDVGTGTQQGNTISNAAVVASNGVFTVTLDFVSAVFDGSARFLEIAVKPAGSGNPLSTLAPRQAVAPIPYAVHSLSAASVANGAVTAAQLAPGAVAANLNAQGQSGIASGGFVLSATDNNVALIGAGYIRFGVTAMQDLWRKRATPSFLAPRGFHTAVWTGTEMIIWGGQTSSPFFEDGGRYNPSTDAWTPVSSNGAPSRRSEHKAVWTGTEMIVWGGIFGANTLGTGGRYNPTTDTWLPVSTNGAPTARCYHTAVWTGSEMIVWGGTTTVISHTPTDSGGRYNPATDTWTPVDLLGAPPDARYSHSAVWNGSQMLIYGGRGNGGDVASGGRYLPGGGSFSWTTLPAFLTERARHSAVWTGSEMILWGGFTTSNFEVTYTGGRYLPANNSWTETANHASPEGRGDHKAVWTGTEMLLWGGRNTPGGQLATLGTGSRYSPASDTWAPVSNAGAPSARFGHTAVWVGNELLVFGGSASANGPYFNDVYGYSPGRTFHLYQRP